MIRETIAAVAHPEDGDRGMRLVEVVMAIIAVVAAGVLALIR
ncbi:MAG TPA: hypothetical protein VH440_13650 [Candidatus Limnocylindrales bacterium]|jgi:hypothetical protein